MPRCDRWTFMMRVPFPYKVNMSFTGVSFYCCHSGYCCGAEDVEVPFEQNVSIGISQTKIPKVTLSSWKRYRCETCAPVLRHIFHSRKQNTARRCRGVEPVQNGLISLQSVTSTRSSTWERSLSEEVWIGSHLQRAAILMCPRSSLPAGRLGRTSLPAQDIPNNKLLILRTGQMNC